MAANTDGHSFWTTFPGILTGIAAIVGSITGLLIALEHFHQPVTITPEIQLTNNERKTEPIVNHSPISNAGLDQVVDGGNTVILNGSKSYDPDGNIITYSWKQFEGPVVKIDDPAIDFPSFTAPIVSRDTLLKFSLMIKDDKRISSNIANVTIFDKATSLQDHDKMVSTRSTNTLASQQSIITNNFTYTNTTYGIAINYPSDWKKEDGAGTGNTPASYPYKSIVTFTPTKINDFNNLLVRIEIDTKPKSNLYSILTDGISVYKKSKYYKNVHYISSDMQSNLSGQPAYSLSFNSAIKGNPTTVLETGTLVGNWLYYVQYMADSDKYYVYLPIVQNMIKSIKITDTK